MPRGTPVGSGRFPPLPRPSSSRLALALLPRIPTMSTGKNARPVSAPTKATQLLYGAAGRWWQRQTLGQLAAPAAIILGLVLATTVADAADPARPVVRGALGVIPTPPAPAAPAPASRTAVPQTQLSPIAPLSSSTLSSTAVPTALPTGGSSGVPLSTPGGGREGLAACLEFWDSATHMTKAEWKAACERSVHRLETITGTKKP